jgi:hypothetical protein
MDHIALDIAPRELVGTTMSKLGEVRHRVERRLLGRFREAADKHIVGHLGA